MTVPRLRASLLCVSFRSTREYSRSVSVLFLRCEPTDCDALHTRHHMQVSTHGSFTQLRSQLGRSCRDFFSVSSGWTRACSLSRLSEHFFGCVLLNLREILVRMSSSCSTAPCPRQFQERALSMGWWRQVGATRGCLLPSSTVVLWFGFSRQKPHQRRRRNFPRVL